MNSDSAAKKDSSLWGDIMGGIMTTVVALPVAMAFGIASGLGPAAGLYGAMACGMFAGIFGGTRGQQSGPTGPIAVVVASLMVSTGNNLPVVFAAIIAGGIFQMLLARLGAGQYVRYLPYPVISGFMTGIAAIIILLHIHPLFGMEGPRKVLDCVLQLGAIPGHVNWSALGIGALTFALIYTLKRISKKIPAALVALLVATGLSVVLHMDLPRIGEIPNQLPMPALPIVSWRDLGTIVVGGLLIAILGAIDSLLTSIVADQKLKTRHDSNKELFGQGLGNVVSGLLGGVAGAGSTTRTLANIDAGGRTPIAALVYGFMIVAVILGLGKFAALIPHSSLAAILIALGIGIIDWRMFERITHTPRSDVLVMFTVLALTVFVDLITAVLVGTALASIIFVKKFSEHIPQFLILSSSSKWQSQLEKLPPGTADQTMLVSFVGPLFFAQARRLQLAMPTLEDCKHVIIHFSQSAFADQSFIYQFEDTVSHLERQNIDVLIVGLNEGLLQLLANLGSKQSSASHRQFSTMEEALKELSGDEKVLQESA